MSIETQSAGPRVGMLATVRNRRAVLTAVEPFDGGPAGRLHLVTAEYIDPDGNAEDQLIWEREPGKSLLEPVALPDVEGDRHMAPDEFDALVRATRWTAMSPFVDPDGEGPIDRLPLVSPFHGAIQTEDFQLVPLLKALAMPRVALLLADDVGLGKTIEAGLILTELILRRRVRRVLILCPASLRTQWRLDEMRDKFSLTFDEVDRASTHALRRRLGLDANPWRACPRIVTSYDYLKQPDVLQEFLAASRPADGSAHLPWDLLIVDEAHNLAPAAYGEDSEVSKTLGIIAPLFEHKLFLTATPHNGHTRSFSGLLERLDPARFERTDALSPSQRARIEEVVVRRLKREINALTNPPRFAGRTLEAIPLALHPAERQLSASFDAFRRRVRELVATGRRGEQLAGAFAVEVLGKRLLSCPATFADSWHRYLLGLAEHEAVGADDVRAAERATREDTADDRESESRTALAAQTVGAWLKPLAARLEAETANITSSLRALELSDGSSRVPSADARFDALVRWIENHLRTPDARWREDERLVVFTEYKTTLDYVEARLAKRYPEHGALRVLYGGMDQAERDAIKAAFNDPADPVRILVATDAASEGLNLQETARFLLHYDVPWNPARLEQRNGRLDRHGQARDVVVHHFATEDEADLRFLAHVVSKVEAIREDLGSTGEVFDAAFQKRLIEGADRETVEREMDRAIAAARGRADVARDSRTGIGEEGAADALARLDALAAEIDLDPRTLGQTLEIALGMHAGRPRFEPPDEAGRVRLAHPIPREWQTIVDDTLRRDAGRGQKGPLPALVFDADFFLVRKNGRLVFRPSRDTTLVHLGHPLYHRALASFARARFPGGAASASRWTVRKGGVPDLADALLLLTVEELAVNELRETFHHWVRTVEVPVRNHALAHPLPQRPARQQHGDTAVASALDVKRARELWDEIQGDARELVKRLAVSLNEALARTLEAEYARELERERDRFRSRQAELSVMIERQTLARLEEEIADLQTQRQQGALFDAEDRLQSLAVSEQARREELERRRSHYANLREFLGRERERVLEELLPRRYAMRGAAQVFPVAVEIRIP